MRKSRLKANSRLNRWTAKLLIALWVMTPGWVSALPSDGAIVSGTGNIEQLTAQDMVIHQNGQHLVTNWQSFNIDVGESVHFQQPNASSVALNRVIGVDPSIIAGKLSATGQVFLSNPSGVVFTPGSKVDVHGLLATTLGIANQDFVDGKYHFTQDPELTLASVINGGTINARQYVGLVAPTVQNNGTLNNNGAIIDGRIIVADLGSVALASGNAATLDFNGDGLISFTITQEVPGVVTDTLGNVINDRINNSGLIQANGGKVALTAQSAGDVIGNVVNHSGIIEAQTVVQKNGIILLASQDTALLDVDGVPLDVERAQLEVVEVEVTQERAGSIVLSGGGEGNVQVAGTLDASNVLVTAGGDRNGTGVVKVAAGDTLLTNGGNISIVADDLVLEGDLNSGTGDVYFTLANLGNLTLSPDGSMGADIGGNDLSHITANNLVLGSTGNITVKGMNEESTRGIAGSVFLVSGGNIIFNVGASVFSALELLAFNSVNVNEKVTTTRGNINISSTRLDLNADLNSGMNDVIFSHWNGGDMNIGPGSTGSLGGDDIGHIIAKNLTLRTRGNISVDGLKATDTDRIMNNVILESGGNITFENEASVFRAVKLSAVTDINVNTDITTTLGDFIARADSDNNGVGDFNVDSSAVITSARDIDVSAVLIDAVEPSLKETRDLILNGDVVIPETRVETSSIQQGTLGSFLTEFFENGGSGGC